MSIISFTRLHDGVLSLVFSLSFLILFLPLLCPKPANGVVSVGQRLALLDLYRHLGGEDWANNKDWGALPGTECSWFGVYCDAKQQQVIALLLKNNNLTGHLRPSIKNLSHLQHLDLSDNFIAGTLPQEIGELTELEVITLRYNQLKGPLPASLGYLTQLTDCNFSHNQLSGEIPDELGLLTELRNLNLEFNELSGEIPGTLGELIKLRNLRLDNNYLTGSLPASLCYLSSLYQLNLSNNNLSGSIPPDIRHLTGLFLLFLQGNEFAGEVPWQIRYLWNLFSNDSDFRWNRLHSSDDYVIAFLKSKQIGGDWQATQSGIAPDGDINADGRVDLTDAILILQLFAGTEPGQIVAGYEQSGVDVDPDSRLNGDDTRIGFAELFFILSQNTETP